jgi:hypothetical protein
VFKLYPSFIPKSYDLVKLICDFFDQLYFPNFMSSQGVEEVSIHCKKITLSSFLVIVLVTSKYTTLFLFSIEHFPLRMKEKVDGVVVHSLGFSAEGSGFESRPRPHFVPPFLKKKYSPIQLLKIHVWGK